MLNSALFSYNSLEFAEVNAHQNRKFDCTSCTKLFICYSSSKLCPIDTKFGRHHFPSNQDKSEGEAAKQEVKLWDLARWPKSWKAFSGQCPEATQQIWWPRHLLIKRHNNMLKMLPFNCRFCSSSFKFCPNLTKFGSFHLETCPNKIYQRNSDIQNPILP